MNEALLHSPYILIKSTYPPYSNSYPLEAIEAAMAATNVGKQVFFLLQGQGVLQLQAKQEATRLKQKSISKKLSVMPLFDVEHILVDKAAISQFNIQVDDFPEALSHHLFVVNQQEIALVTARAQHVLVF